MRNSRYLVLVALMIFVGCNDMPTDTQSSDSPAFAKGGGKGKPGGGGGGGTEEPIRFSSVEADINGGRGNSCGLDVEGKAYCWGSNYNFELGLGGKKKGTKTTPVAVTGGHAFHSLSLGQNHSCGIEDVGNPGGSGPILCWGWNEWGGVSILGDGTTTNRAEPTYTAEGTRAFLQVVASTFATCAIADPGDGSDAGPLYCWGLNTVGTFGDGTTESSSVPTLAAAGMSFKEVAVMSGTGCGIVADGAAWCWGGSNEYGTLGNGTIGVPSLVPVPVSGGLVFDDIVANSGGVCALTTGGEIYCWGREAGLASGANQSVPTPLPVSGIADATFTALTTSFCAIGTSGQAYCWGDNRAGMLGSGVFGGESRVPVAVGAPGLFESISGGWWHACGIATDGYAYCWGWNDNGELGNGTFVAEALPTKVVGQ